ncbi:MAG: hypothetical protein HONBIEJF_00772 [Fimbriimonadaceae bacterium]|nr:hypothetical protein [Fimbriimonadaceae bacterium]
MLNPKPGHLTGELMVIFSLFDGFLPLPDEPDGNPCGDSAGNPEAGRYTAYFQGRRREDVSMPDALTMRAALSFFTAKSFRYYFPVFAAYGLYEADILEDLLRTLQGDSGGLSWRTDYWGSREIIAAQRLLRFIHDRDSKLSPDGYSKEASELVDRFKEALAERSK